MLYGKVGQKVEASGLVKHYGTVAAVRDVSLDVQPGEFVTLLGPSGCGKTTVLKMIAGLIPGHGGEIRFGGERIDHLPPNRRNIGLVFQNYQLFPHMTVEDNIGYGLRMRRWPKDKRRERVDEMLALVRLEGVVGRRPEQLSGGQQQRVALARALAFMPDLLLLDEPFSNLDAKLREEVRAHLRDIQRRTQQTTIFVTHDQDEALVISDRIVLMNHGTVEQVDAPEQLYSMPETEFAARFIGASNIVRGTYMRSADGESIAIDGIDAPLPVSTKASGVGPSGSAVAACIRPEHIVVRPRNASDDIARAWPRAFVTAGRIVDIVFHGSLIILTLNLPGLGRIRCQRLASELQGLGLDEKVLVGILDCHLMPGGD